jgi:hypothetical protein
MVVMKKSVLAAIVMILSTGIACQHAKKTTAEAAVRLADQAWTSLGPQAKTLAPEQFKTVQDSLAAAHEALNKGDYDAALAAAKDLPAQVKALTVAVQAKKGELTAKWEQLNDTMPGLVSAVQSRIESLTKTHHLPKGAADGLASAKQNWGNAASAFQSGQLADALSKGSEAQTKLTDLQKRLGMKQI